MAISHPPFFLLNSRSPRSPFSVCPFSRFLSRTFVVTSRVLKLLSTFSSELIDPISRYQGLLQDDRVSIPAHPSHSFIIACPSLWGGRSPLSIQTSIDILLPPTCLWSPPPPIPIACPLLTSEDLYGALRGPNNLDRIRCPVPYPRRKSALPASGPPLFLFPFVLR